MCIHTHTKKKIRCVSIYIPGQKYRPPTKMKKKILFTIFKL